MGIEFLTRWVTDRQNVESAKQREHATRQQQYGELIRAAAVRDLSSGEEKRLQALTDSLGIDAETIEKHVAIVQSYTRAKAMADAIPTHRAARQAASDALMALAREREQAEADFRQRERDLNLKYGAASHEYNAAEGAKKYLAELVANNPDLLN
jgi:hypothetical protein